MATTPRTQAGDRDGQTIAEPGLIPDHHRPKGAPRMAEYRRNFSDPKKSRAPNASWGQRHQDEEAEVSQKHLSNSRVFWRQETGVWMSPKTPL
jgi:hypothetical protein